MAWNKMAPRPNTCCTSTGTANNNVERHVSQQRQAWMAFHKRRPDPDMVTTPMSWPGCGRPPAGLATLEADYRKSRLVSTAQPAPRQKPQPRLLPPIDVDKAKSKGSKARGSRHKNERSIETDETNFASPTTTWARQWACQRAKQAGFVTRNAKTHDMEMSDDEEDSYQQYMDHKRACAVPYQKRRQKVVSFNEREAATMKRLRGIYCNTKEKFQRVGRLKESIKALQDKTLHTEVDESLREYEKKTKIDKGNRKELKRVRDRYFKDKQRRNKLTHISLNALESPQVSRHAYGLPEEGKEFEETKLAKKTEQRLQEIWKKAVRRAIVIDKIITLNKKEPEPSLPQIKVKRPSISKEPNLHGAHAQTSPKTRNDLIDLHASMTELEDGLYSVGSDSENDDLTDIGEED